MTGDIPEWERELIGLPPSPVGSVEVDRDIKEELARMTDDLITWLRAQLDEDERVARAAGAKWYVDAEGDIRQDRPDGTPYVVCGPYGGGIGTAEAEHIVRHDPARVLAEVDAKRRIVDFCADLLRPDSASTLTDPEDVDPNSWHVVRMLALPYADRPGYRAEWRP